ncbi:hypothetical protein [Kingella negevensis]|uniref:hypothetical protein n=1 Tax=Kingella negevensis TaxID=1522312 RepID=UPI00050A0D2B|nr:hypothetical protein [Kingella negevensis]MDK4688770.1 hypothetical protein [Kingella negevensis]
MILKRKILLNIGVAMPFWFTILLPSILQKIAQIISGQYIPLNIATILYFTSLAISYIIACIAQFYLQPESLFLSRKVISTVFGMLVLIIFSIPLNFWVVGLLWGFHE